MAGSSRSTHHAVVIARGALLGGRNVAAIERWENIVGASNLKHSFIGSIKFEWQKYKNICFHNIFKENKCAI